MCGRYYRAGDKQAIAEYFRAELADGLPALDAEYNIPPTSTQPVLRQSRDTGRRELTAMRWGLVGFGTQGSDPKRATFNARAETLERSALWRTPLHKRRCLIPISGFYEWKLTPDAGANAALDQQQAVHSRPSAVKAAVAAGTGRTQTKHPFRFSFADAPFFALAGLWDAWKSPAGDWLQSMSIITVAANPTMAPYHDRMPAILHPRDYDEWLDRDEIERAPTHLLRPYDGPGMVIHQAHANVGNVRNQGPELLNSQ